jgi:hypothetical protein
MDDKAFWITFRRALLLIVKAIEDKYQIETSKPSTHK